MRWEATKIHVLLKPKKLTQLEVLRKRMVFCEEYRELYYALQSGYDGELRFADLLERRLNSKPMIIHDLKLKIGTNECQIDCLIIFYDEIYIFEVKNFKGDFEFGEKWWIQPNNEPCVNPLNQLNRTESLVRKLFKRVDFDLRVSAYLVFIHPSFVLYRAPKDKRMIFPGQLNKLLEEWNRIPCLVSDKEKRVYDTLLQYSLEKSGYETELEFNYEEIKKGFPCEKCNEMMKVDLAKNRYGLICRYCGFLDSTEKALLRNISDFRVLFPNRKINMKEIRDWTDGKLTERQIRYVLNKHFVKHGNGRGAFYSEATEKQPHIK